MRTEYFQELLTTKLIRLCLRKSTPLELPEAKILNVYSPTTGALAILPSYARPFKARHCKRLDTAGVQSPISGDAVFVEYGE